MSAQAPPTEAPEVAEAEVRRLTLGSIILGALLVIGGIVGLLYVVLATITSAILFAWLLIVAGILAFLDAWRRRGRDGFWASAITGVANFAAGVVILWRPAESLLALTMLVAAFLLVGGTFRIVTGLAGGVPGAGWLVLHGVFDVVLAVLIIANLPEASFYVLGVMLSVSLLADGVALIVLGTVAHRGLGRIATWGTGAARMRDTTRPRHA
ncbi:MAG: hypothetical protein QOH75_68 [Actinomycetota bacterium]|jgi:uncharacterized membrane protein HdeD (DUF308 family)|nr:hypothetical protein [Actinomycetota bacterium]MDQ1668554.1 hypothetical protein [Actinomycetota bacterium]